jgi:E3 ubiquitin-protein ligase HUWE1
MDDDEDDEDDSDEDDEDDEDDEVDSADMEDVEDRVEIVDEDGNLIEDDGESGWESETSAEEDDGPEVDIDYEGEVQEADEAHLHGMGPGDLLDNMARAIMGGDEDGYEPELMEALDEHYMDDGHDEGGMYNISLFPVYPMSLRADLNETDDDDEEDIEDEEYIYDDDYPCKWAPLFH